MRRLLPLLLLMGCNTPQVPCLDGMTIDAHQTNGNYDDYRYGFEDGDEPFNSRVNGDYDAFTYGGSLHFAIGKTPRKCGAYGGSE